MTERRQEPLGFERMPQYESDQWDHLQEYWSKRADARGLPTWLVDGASKVAAGAGKAGHALGRLVPAPVKAAAEATGDAVLGKALRPVLSTALHVLELVNDWAVELQDPARVLAIARKHHVDVVELSDLRRLPLKSCDRLLTRNTLKWRTAGALEGAAMGSLALVPVVGMPISITADVIVMDVLTASIATRVAYSYGFDAKDPAEKQFVELMVSSALTNQLGKAAPLNKTSQAHQATWKRQRWSKNLREDHQLVVAMEKFMAKWYPKGRVPVAHVGKGLSVLAIVIGAGANSYTLARVADHTQKYCQTRRLCEQYGLPLPLALAKLQPGGSGSDVDGHDPDDPLPGNLID